MTLVDTSIWIEVFRKNRPLDLTAQVPFDDVVTCLPVIQEVLQGIREERAYRVARDAMLALHRDRDFAAISRISPLRQRNA